MLANPMDILIQFPVRKTKVQKQMFRTAVKSYGEKLGYTVTVEQGRFGAHNVILGNPEKAKFLVTAHYDTCAKMLLPNFITPCNVPVYLAYQLGLILLMGIGAIAAGVVAGLLLGSWAVKWTILVVYLLLLGLLICGPANRNNANDNTSGVVTLLEIARTMPENQRHKVCFVLFDLEEAGLIGSSSYRKMHKGSSSRQIVLNLDCEGDGDHIRLFPGSKLKKDRKKLTSLYKACGYFGKKDVLIHEKGLYLYPSDQSQFPYGVGICALNKGRFGLSMGKIHTRKDTTLDETNVNILRAALTSLITCDNEKGE